METDCRIAAQHDFILYQGETWEADIQFQDPSNADIDVTGFTVGDMSLYDNRRGGALQATLTGITIVSGKLKILNDISESIKKEMVKGYYYKCPLTSPAGKKAILHGIIKMDGK